MNILHNLIPFREATLDDCVLLNLLWEALLASTCKANTLKKQPCSPLLGLRGLEFSWVKKSRKPQGIGR